METVPLWRQDSLLKYLEDFLANWLQHDLVHQHITATEMNWIWEYVSNKLGVRFQPRVKENATMAHVGTIVQRKAQETIPDDALDVFAGTNDGYVGYAMVEDGELTIGQLPGGETDTLETIKETMANKPIDIQMMFAKGADSDESQQPFNTLQDDKGNCLCAIFIEGDLQGFEAVESSHSLEYNAHQQYLGAKLSDLYTICGKDLAQVVQRLDSNLTRKELTSTCFPTPDARGEILIVFANGQTVNIVKGDKHKKYSWGEVSQSLGYASKEEPTTREKIITLKKGMGKPIVSKEPDNQAVKAAFVKATNDKANADHAKATNLQFMIRPPADKYSSFKELQGWYRAFGHKEHQPKSDDIAAIVDKPHKVLPVLVKSDLSNAAFNALMTGNKIFLADDQTKGKAPSVVKPETVIPVAIIPAAELEKTNKEFWPKIVKAIQNFDDGSRLIIPPDKAAELVKSRPVATEQMGRQMGLEEFEQLSADAWRMLQKIAPETIISVLMQYQYQRYMDHRAVKDAAGIKKAM